MKFSKQFMAGILVVVIGVGCSKNPVDSYTFRFTNEIGFEEVSSLADGIVCTATDGQYVYATLPKGFIILKIGVDKSLTQVAQVDIDFRKRSSSVHYDDEIVVAGDLLFLTGGLKGLYIYNILDRSHPALVGHHFDDGSDIHDVEVDGNYAFVLDAGESMRAYDITNPGQPILISEFTNSSLYGNRYDDVEVSPGLLYLLHGGIINSYDISTLPPTEIGSTYYIIHRGFGGHLASAGNYLCAGFSVFCGTYCSDPRIGCFRNSVLNELDTLSGPYQWPFGGLAMSGNLLFHATSRELVVYSLSGTSAPVQLGSLWLSASPASLDVNSGTAVLADSLGINVVDVSVPSAPKEVSRYVQSAIEAVQDVDRQGSAVFITNTNGLYAIDVSDPSNPKYMGAVGQQDGFGTLEIQGAIAYTVGKSNGFYSFDISDPSDI